MQSFLIRERVVKTTREDDSEHIAQHAAVSNKLPSAVPPPWLVGISHPRKIRKRGRWVVRFVTTTLAQPTSALIAPPAMPRTITTDIAACNNMSILAARVSGNASVGLNAKFVVKAINR